MSFGICVNCALEIEFDEHATDDEKPYPYWEGMWRSPTTGSVECAGENPHVQTFGWPERVYRMHDPVQQFLVSYHATGGSLGEAIYAQEQWLVDTRADAESLREAFERLCIDLRVEEYLFQVVPLGIDVAKPNADGGWTQVISRFKEYHLAGYGDEDE